MTHQASSTVPSGRVIGTRPASGSTEPKGTTITIVASSGAKKVSVPNVVGLSLSAAEAKLAQNHLKWTVNPGHSSSYGPGKVINQTPAPNTSLAAGKYVILTVNSQATTLTVPNIVLGLKQDAATQVLSSAPYFYQVIPVIAQGGGFGPGDVYGTSPAIGKPLAKGSTITIYVNPSAATQSPTPSPSTSSPSPSPSTSSPSPNPT